MATLHLGTSGGLAQAKAIYVNDASAGLQTVKLAYVGTTGGNQLIFATLSVSASPEGVYATGDLATTLTTAAIIVTATGGSGAYSYAWSVSSQHGYPCAAVAPSSASTAIQCTIPGGGEPGVPVHDVVTATCTVTDTVTGLTEAVSVPANFTAS